MKNDNDNNKRNKFFGFEVSDPVKYAIIGVLAIILITQLMALL